MKIALINGSPKLKESASGYILSEVMRLIEDNRTAQPGKDSELLTVEIHNPVIDIKTMEELSQCDVLVFAFPLYIDSIPSHLLNTLSQLENYFTAQGGSGATVYALVNCGFYEGKQNVIAIEIMRHWAKRSGLVWGQGIGIGGGAMLQPIKNIPNGHGPKKNFSTVLINLVQHIYHYGDGSDQTLENKGAEEVFINMNIPRFAYIQAAHFKWRKLAKENGLKRKNLFKRK